MPVFLTLRDAEGTALATAMLPPQQAGRDGPAACSPMVVGPGNGDPYPEHGAPSGPWAGTSASRSTGSAATRTDGFDRIPGRHRGGVFEVSERATRAGRANAGDGLGGTDGLRRPLRCRGCRTLFVTRMPACSTGHNMGQAPWSGARPGEGSMRARSPSGAARGGA
jgi:hypothetical protein